MEIPEIKLESPLNENALKVRRNLLLVCTIGLIVKVFGSEIERIKILPLLIEATPQQALSIISIFLFYLWGEWLVIIFSEVFPWWKINRIKKKWIRDKRDFDKQERFFNDMLATETPTNNPIKQNYELSEYGKYKRLLSHVKSNSLIKDNEVIKFENDFENLENKDILVRSSEFKAFDNFTKRVLLFDVALPLAFGLIICICFLFDFMDFVVKVFSYFF